MDDRDHHRPYDRPRSGSVLGHFSARLDPLTSALLVFPLFLTYQVGILCQAGRGQNGVDFLTRTLIELCDRDMDTYLVTLACLFAAYGCVLLILRPRGTFRSEAFLPVLAESIFYATTMGTLILVVIDQLGILLVAPELAIGGRTVADILVLAAGAGLHEELVFRVVGMAGLGWLLAGVTGPRTAWVLALVGSSLVFSLAHHVGPGVEAFTFTAFAYRALAGAFFGIVYHLRGFAVAAWTHALYDVYVLTM